jgi:hypothetical protein
LWLFSVEHASSGSLCLVLCTNFYFTFILCLFGGKLYLYSTQISSIEFLYAVADDDVYTITEYTKKTRNVYVSVPGIHHYAVNILWTVCVVHSKLSQVLMLHSCLGGSWFGSWDHLSWLKFVVQLLLLQADTSVIFSIRP